MKKIYYIFFIIKEAIEPIPAKDIRNILLEKYDIKIDIKTIYQAIDHLNELFDLFCGKKLIKTIFKILLFLIFSLILLTILSTYY